MKPLSLFSLFLIPVFALAGCNPVVTQVANLNETKVVEPSLTVVLSPTFTTSSMPTPHPTLSRAEADQIIAKLMKENGNCSAPCFWGITPGSSSLADSVGFITALSSSFGWDVFTQTKNSETSYSTDFTQKENMAIGIALLERDGKLLNITVQVLGLLDENIKSDDWLAFRPESLMKTYGVPKKVEIYLSQSPVAYSYGIIFYYDQLIIEYHNGDIIPSKNTRICPLREHETKSFYFGVGREFEHTPIGGKNIEELTQLSVNDFYNILTGDPQKACFNVNFDAYRK